MNLNPISTWLIILTLLSWTGFVEYMGWSGWFSIPAFIFALITVGEHLFGD